MFILNLKAIADNGLFAQKRKDVLIVEISIYSVISIYVFCNYLIITYDIIEDIMEAIKDCCYHFEQYQEDWLFKNEKVMFIDSSIGYSLYNNDEYYKIDMN